MAESSGEQAPRWYDDLEPRRHMIAERSNEKLNSHEAKKKGLSCMADRALSKLTANKALLKLDLTNAFNTVRRDKMLASV